MPNDDTPITLRPAFEYTKAVLGSYRDRDVCARFSATNRWIIVRLDGGQVLSDTDQWEPIGALLPRNLVPIKAMYFSGPDKALEHLRTQTHKN